MNKTHCVICGFILEDPSTDFVSVCYGCTAFSSEPDSFLATYVPAVCGDEECFSHADGMVNLDGKTCSHAEDFYSVFDNL